jgi:hypothetical protein
LIAGGPASAQEQLPWLRDGAPAARDDAYRPPGDAYSPRAGAPSSVYTGEAYRPPQQSYGQGYGAYGNGPSAGAPYDPGRNGNYVQGPPPPYAQPYVGPGQPYTPGPGYNEPAYGRYGAYDRPYGPPSRYDDYNRDTYSSSEILDAGHRFFGTVSRGLAKVVEYAFQRQGRPNGYILGQDAGGAFVAGLRYGEGMLYTKDAGVHRVFWQGPSIGYDAGAEGSKVMTLVYNLRHPGEMYQRFGGIDGSAYFVGGVGLTFQKSGDVVVAPIRSGVGLRFGANVGYLKYTPRPTWNPF